MFKGIILPIILIIAFLVSVVFLLPKYTGYQLIGHRTLHEDHVRLEALEARLGFAMTMFHADTTLDHKEINKKLDLLLNIATNTIDSVRVVR